MTEETDNKENITTTLDSCNEYVTDSTSTSLIPYTTTTTALVLHSDSTSDYLPVPYETTTTDITTIRCMGVVYRWVNKKECDEKGFAYIGSTADEHTRKSQFTNVNTEYAGDKINGARRKYGTGYDVWEYEILQVIYAENEDELRSQLLYFEDCCMIIFDTVNHGYNTRTNKFWHHSEETKLKIGASNLGHDANTMAVNVINKDGDEKFYESQLSCSEALGINQGLISYYLRPENQGKYYQGKLRMEKAN